jgi:hypothetical protein
VVWAAFVPGHEQLLLALRADDPRQHDDELVHWDYRSGKAVSRQTLPQLGPVAAAATGRGAFVAGANFDVFAPGSAESAYPNAWRAPRPRWLSRRAPTGACWRRAT